jgi:hypothetical protein
LGISTLAGSGAGTDCRACARANGFSKYRIVSGGPSVLRAMIDLAVLIIISRCQP